MVTLAAGGIKPTLRIALISLHFAEYAARLALALSQRHSVQLHLSRVNADAELSDALRAELEGVVEVRLHSPVTRLNCLAHGFRLARQIRQFRPDIVHGQEAGDWAHAVARMFIGTAPFVYTVHDPRPHSGNDRLVARRNLWPRRLLRLSADAIIVHGWSIVAEMEAAEPATKGRVYVAMHGLLGDSLLPQEAPGDEFMFFGRIEAYKGLDVLLDAVALLLKRGEPVRLRIVGRGPDLDRHRSCIAQLPSIELDEAFVPAAQVSGLLREARAIVLPYRDATQSGVVTNAFAAGVPVIASRVGALVDVLDDGSNALLVPPSDPERLADAIARLAADDDLTRRLARGAAATASSLLAWSDIARETEIIYGGLRMATGCGREIRGVGRIATGRR